MNDKTTADLIIEASYKRVATLYATRKNMRKNAPLLIRRDALKES